MAASKCNAVDLAVHDAVRKGLGGEHDGVGGLTSQCEGGEACTVGLKSLASVLLNTVELHEALDEVGPAHDDAG